MNREIFELLFNMVAMVPKFPSVLHRKKQSTTIRRGAGGDPKDNWALVAGVILSLVENARSSTVSFYEHFILVFISP